MAEPIRIVECEECGHATRLKVTDLERELYEALTVATKLGWPRDTNDAGLVRDAVARYEREVGDVD